MGVRDVLWFLFGFVAGLGLLSWPAASVVVSRTAQGWFGPDLLLRSDLTSRAAGGTAALHRGHPARLDTLPVELAHGERTLGAAACGADLRRLARTGDSPRAPLRLTGAST
jgi:hypothetical protein